MERAAVSASKAAQGRHARLLSIAAARARMAFLAWHCVGRAGTSAGHRPRFRCVGKPQSMGAALGAAIVVVRLPIAIYHLGEKTTGTNGYVVGMDSMAGSPGVRAPMGHGALQARQGGTRCVCMHSLFGSQSRGPPSIADSGVAGQPPRQHYHGLGGETSCEPMCLACCAALPCMNVAHA